MPAGLIVSTLSQNSAAALIEINVATMLSLLLLSREIALASCRPWRIWPTVLAAPPDRTMRHQRRFASARVVKRLTKDEDMSWLQPVHLRRQKK
jgi:hypothetical protein